MHNTKQMSESILILNIKKKLLKPFQTCLQEKPVTEKQSVKKNCCATQIKEIRRCRLRAKLMH